MYTAFVVSVYSLLQNGTEALCIVLNINLHDTKVKCNILNL